MVSNKRIKKVKHEDLTFKVKRIELRQFEVIILRIEGTPVESLHKIHVASTKKRAQDWIKNFTNKNKKQRVRFLSKKGISLRIPKTNKYVVASFEIGNNKVKTQFINKTDLCKSAGEDGVTENPDSFDGINRIKEMNPDVVFASDKKIRLRKHKTITQKIVSDKISKKKKKIYTKK
jgi:hypothetical protein